MVKNLLTIDVEEWFHTSALEQFIPRNHWHLLESRVLTQTRKVLRILDEMGVRATFFILGWVAERYPDLVREIDALGHEVASHGYQHRLIYRLDWDIFQDYVNCSKQILEDLIGKPVLGYRATSFSIVKETLWALDVIREAGFVYDSSIFPIRHDIYGVDGFPRHPFVHANGLIEVPPSTILLLGKNIPVAGGGYLRFYPYWLTRQAIMRLNRVGHPAVVYLHPWELDPDCPKIRQADRRTRFRQYVNLHQTEKRLKSLLSEFSFGSSLEYVQNAGLASNTRS